MATLTELWEAASEEERSEFVRAMFREMPSEFYGVMCEVWGQDVVDKELDKRPETKEFILKMLKAERERGNRA